MRVMANGCCQPPCCQWSIQAKWFGLGIASSSYRSRTVQSVSPRHFEILRIDPLRRPADLLIPRLMPHRRLLYPNTKLTKRNAAVFRNARNDRGAVRCGAQSSYVGVLHALSQQLRLLVPGPLQRLASQLSQLLLLGQFPLPFRHFFPVTCDTTYAGHDMT